MISPMTHRWIQNRIALIAISGFANLLVAQFAAAISPDENKNLAAEEVQFFEAKVRPILVEHCYECHATDSETIEAGLVLDSKWGWETGGDSGPAIVPHSPNDSLLIEAVRYQENVISGMPPRSKLAEEQIEILEKWIEIGAPDPREKVTGDPSDAKKETFDLNQRFNDHWSWRPIIKPALPTVEQNNWAKNPIDQFVLASQQQRGLYPADPADKPTWLRRVYFDLIGLPPSQEQLEAFISDDAHDAHEKVVDDLLNSVLFGEKWARHWLDLMRYAESYGHEFDYALPHATEYRDYVIRALNADVPYDQFVREHLAGDLLQQPRKHPEQLFNESVIGTGFWYLHEATHAPTDVLGNEADIMDNQIDVFGKAFLGLTVACARCHDHKFDAISTQDYYAISAHIHSSARQEVNLDIGEQHEKAREAIDEKLTAASRALNDSAKRTAEFIEALRGKTSSQSLPTQLQSPTVNAESQLFEQFGEGKIPDGWVTTDNAFRPIDDTLSVRTDGSLAMPNTIDSGYWGNKQVGSLRSPTFLIEKNNIHLLIKSTANIKIQAVIDNYQMTGYNGLLFGGILLSGGATDTGGKWAWKTIGGNLNKYIGHRCYLEIIDQGDAEIAIDQIMFSNGGAPGISEAEPLDEAQFVEQLAQSTNDLAKGRSNRWIAWQSQLAPSLITEVALESKDLIESAKQINETVPGPRFALAMAQGTVEDAAVYVRGSHKNLGETVPPRNLAALGGTIGSRLDLANQLVSPENPLTSRVLVNRLWHHLFGTGIVPTVDDFGPQGQKATNPQLLNWLASDHMDSGWSIKHTIRSIVLSATYRQQSKPASSLSAEVVATKDPTNQTLYFMPVRRLTGESIRDAMLMISGSLNDAHYGGSVPTHRTEFMTGRGARGSGPLDGNGRRSIYLAVYRNFLNPFFATFDTPNPFGPQGRRSVSNVPAQALALMNDPLVIELSNRWGKAIAANTNQSMQDRIREMVIAAHTSEPTPEQIAMYEQFLNTQAEVHGGLNEIAWSDLAHALFNMKAFYFLK